MRWSMYNSISGSNDVFCIVELKTVIFFQNPAHRLSDDFKVSFYGLPGFQVSFISLEIPAFTKK
jgi:hypothetical protein